MPPSLPISPPTLPGLSPEVIQDILVLSTTSHALSRSALEGVADFMRGRMPWNISLHRPEQTDGIRLPKHFKGILHFSGPWSMLRPWIARGIPIVTTSQREMNRPIPSIRFDDAAIGRMAAEHLLEKRLRHHAVLSKAGTRFAQVRLAAFKETIRAAGWQCQQFIHPDEKIFADAHSSEKLLAWLKALPKPTSLFAIQDTLALPLISLCRMIGLRVPDDVAILGVNNDILLNSLAHPPLSSIMLPAQAMGYQAATLLAELLAGRPLAQQAVVLPPVGVHVRQSTDVLIVDDPDVIAAYRFIHRHAYEPIDVADVCDHVALSRRTLERRFLQVLDRTLGAEIRRARVAGVCDFLRTTRLSLTEVAQRCGFSSQQDLHRVFKRQFGLTPRAYRLRYDPSDTLPSPEVSDTADD